MSTPAPAPAPVPAPAPKGDVTDFFRSAAKPVIEKEPPLGENEPPKPEDQQQQQKEQQKKPSHIENINELKKKKDLLEARVKELEEDAKSKKQIIDEYNVVKPIVDHIKTKEQKLDNESVNNYINRQKERKKVVEEYGQKLTEKEKRLQEIEITSSDLWKNEYEIPLIKAKDAFVATLTNVDSEGKPRHPELVEHLVESLSKVNEKTGEPLNAMQIRAIVAKFAKEYEDNTGIPYEVPTILEIKDSLDMFIGKYKESYVAKQNWKKVSEEKRVKELAKMSEEQKRRMQEELSARDLLITETINNIDYSEFQEAFQKDDVMLQIQNEHKHFVDSMTGKTAQRDYHEHVVLSAKGKLFDKLISEFKSVKDQLKAEKEKNRSSIPNGGRRITEEEHEEKLTIKKGQDVAAFLK